VKEAWKLVLDEEALQLLLSCRLADRRKLLASLERLKRNPHQSGDFAEHDDTGRPLEVKVFGNFLITYWRDQLVQELRVVEIERIRSSR